MEMNRKEVDPLQVRPIHGFGARLKKLRLENKMTMEKFGEVIGVSAPTIAAYESESRSPRLEVISSIAEKFNCSVDFILGLTDVREIKQDIYDAYNFFMKEQINWHGRPIDPNDLTAFRALLEQIMDAKTGYQDRKQAATAEMLPFEPEKELQQETNYGYEAPDYLRHLDNEKDNE